MCLQCFVYNNNHDKKKGRTNYRKGLKETERTEREVKHFVHSPAYVSPLSLANTECNISATIYLFMFIGATFTSAFFWTKMRVPVRDFLSSVLNDNSILSPRYSGRNQATDGRSSSRQTQVVAHQRTEQAELLSIVFPSWCRAVHVWLVTEELYAHCGFGQLTQHVTNF